LYSLEDQTDFRNLPMALKYIAAPKPILKASKDRKKEAEASFYNS
jgi:hypothetical protein